MGSERTHALECDESSQVLDSILKKALLEALRARRRWRHHSVRSIGRRSESSAATRRASAAATRRATDREREPRRPERHAPTAREPSADTHAPDALRNRTAQTPVTHRLTSPTHNAPPDEPRRPTPPITDPPAPIQRTVIPNLPLYFFNSFHHLSLKRIKKISGRVTWRWCGGEHCGVDSRRIVPPLYLRLTKRMARQTEQPR